MNKRIDNISSMVTDVQAIDFLFTTIYMASLGNDDLVCIVKDKEEFSQFYLDCEKNKGKVLSFYIVDDVYRYEFYNSFDELYKSIDRNITRLNQLVSHDDSCGINPHFVGFLLYTLPQFSRYTKYLLDSWSTATITEAVDAIDKVLIPIVFNFWEAEIYMKEKNPDNRDKLKRLFTNDIELVRKAIAYNKREIESYPIFEKLKEYLTKEEGKLVIQIGSSSGRELAYLSKEYRQHEYIGTDISDVAVAYSNNKHSSNNLVFVFSYAHKIKSLIDSLSKEFRYAENIVIFGSGSLQYVQPEHLEIFFRDLGQVKNVDFFISEPVFESHLLDGSTYRGTFTSTHNYKYYAEKNGIRTIESNLHGRVNSSLGVKLFCYIGSTRKI